MTETGRQIYMKKRILSVLLIAVLAFSFISSALADGIPANAAETVTIAKGDTMYSLCQKNGFSYSTYKELIMKLNNITDESKLIRIAAGKKIVLPTSKEAADALCELLGVDISKKQDEKKQNKPFSVVGDASKIPVGDVAVYYIISYTMRSGDTVSDLLKKWDMSFKTYSQQILSLNSLSDFNHITAGRTLYFPVEKIELTNDGSFTVVEHTVKSGDTAFSICRSYGMNYDKALVTLRLLNPNVDFTKIKIGQKLYIPVNGVVILGSESTEKLDGNTYSGYGVVVSCDELIRIRRENVRQDLGLNIGAGAIPAGYTPKAGDYIYFVYNTVDNTLSYIKFIYNVFS